MTTLNIPPEKVWLVTGCATGFGRAIAETLLSAGYRVAVGSLSTSEVADIVDEYPETALAVELDVTNSEMVTAAVASAEEKFGSIDVLVNNAGFGFVGAIEEGEREEFAPMIEVNLYGTLNMIKAVLPGMRRRSRGHIMNISSVGGFHASAAFGMYSVSKFGVEAISESLSVEVAPLGIKVTAVEPGQLRTNFRGSSMHYAKKVIADYAETCEKTRSFIAETHGTQPGDPKKAAAVLIEIAESPNPPFRLPLGSDAYSRVRAKLAAVEEDIAQFEKQAISINYEGVVTESRV